MTLVNNRADVPVTIDESLCIDGCTLCVEVCPLDALAINPDTGRAYMYVDDVECARTASNVRTGREFSRFCAREAHPKPWAHTRLVAVQLWPSAAFVAWPFVIS